MSSNVAINDACRPNISPLERRKRLLSGIVAFVIALAILSALMLTGASRWWRLALYPVFAAATVGFFQWRDKT